MKKRWVWGSAAAAVTMAVAAVAVTIGGVALPFGSAPKAVASDKSPGGKDGQRPEVALEFAPREIVRPAVARLPGQVEFSGPLVAPQTAIVRAKAGGTLLTLAVSEGSRVQAGQAIGRIEMADLASRMAERGALLESARAAYLQAERLHASNERLVAQQFISQIALDNSRAALDTARANLAATQAALDTTRVGLRDGTLLAPIAGIVAKRHVLPGEKVSLEQPVLTIVDLSRLELAGSVGTHEVARIQPGMAVQVRVEGVSQPVDGRIARIAPAAEPGTRSIGVAIEVPNPTERFRAGQYAIVRATLADDADRLTLPQSAVGNTSGQDHVWVIEAGVLARRAVTVGRRDPEAGRVEVLHGVTPASQVLGARFDNLREGAKAVVVVDRSAPALAPVPAATPPAVPAMPAPTAPAMASASTAASVPVLR